MASLSVSECICQCTSDWLVSSDLVGRVWLLLVVDGLGLFEDSVVMVLGGLKVRCLFDFGLNLLREQEVKQNDLSSKMKAAKFNTGKKKASSQISKIFV